MNLSIKYRLFLAFLLATCTLVGCMFLVMRFSFERGFLRHINHLEQARLEQLGDGLLTAYEQRGNWLFLKHQERAWVRLLAESDPEAPSRQLFGDNARDRLRGDSDSRVWPARRLARHAPHLFESRVALLDAEGRLIVGFRSLGQEETLRPLNSNGKTVGYLTLQPPRHISNPLQQRFAERQRRAFALIALVMAAASALLSVPLAQRLVRRITGLAAATHQLSAGHYDIRVQATAGDELGQLARDFNSLAQALEQNQQLRRQWVADISHELRTPLAVLRGEIEALQDGVRPLNSRSLITLHEEVMHLNRLVEDLYQLSLADINALSYRMESLELAEVLRLAIEPFRGEFARRDLTLHCNLPENSKLHIEGDRRRLHQLIGNLLENSLRYTHQGGSVEIGVAESTGEIVLQLDDTAPGVHEDKLPFLFDRLFRIETSRSRSSGGAGLGLSLCKTIVEAHQGTIVAKSSPLGGLRVEIRLPKKD